MTKDAARNGSSLGCLDQLATLMAVPATVAGGEPTQVVGALLDTLLGTLRLAFVFARLNDPDGGPPIEIVRESSAAAVASVRSLASTRLGAQGELGIIVAGSPCADFPSRAEQLLLEVAASQATIGLQHARLLQARDRMQQCNDAVNSDIEERRRTAEALSKVSSELAHVSRVTTLGALTASIAHEVNQPLSGIITNAGTCIRMLDGDLPNIDGAREAARRILRDGNRASEVTARLRVLFSKKTFTLEMVDLNEATREVLALSGSDLQRNGIVVRSELADDLPRISGDRIQLQQVILNLLRNASDAMVDIHDHPRQLLIKTEREAGDRVRVTVRDAGVGVDPQTIDTLFNTFYTTKREGMGVGLSISRSIIERHQGRLWAEPNDGPGATFAFSIPSDAGAESGPAQAVTAPRTLTSRA